MTTSFVHPYLPNSAPEVRAEMLAAVGAESVEEFYADIPAALRLTGDLDLPEPLVAEADLSRHVRGILGKNRTRLSFLGAGTYHHHVPAVVDEVIGRSEFLTAYAGEPYEDHGRFQALFEYASLLAELLEVEVVNVPTYDSLQATATALSMAVRATGRTRILVVSDVRADVLSKVEDFIRPYATLEHVPTVDGIADVGAVTARLGDDVAAVWVSTPSATGAVETAMTQLAEATHAVGGLLVAQTDPIGLGVLAPPAAQGADITCGDIQSLGIHAWFGGGHAGFVGVADDPRLVMEMPHRLFGLASTSVEGEYGFGDVAWDRTAFAHREEGKEWVGTAAALWGIAAGVYLALMGPQGMVELGETLLARTAYARRVLTALPGVSEADGAVHLREFVLHLPRPAAEVVEELRAKEIEPGVVLGERELLVCVTEMTTKDHIDLLARELSAVLGTDTRTPVLEEVAR
ncbi:aminomethyl-transferring glycine dehydrogenase subunit GcvPA [Ruania rhizosphaerae]|uniref:aminomethyl-transferring glycine dehydrogenase subunit GcvPA n=1 Tax=Ruania rhizosphaerae TaxID=1840413 RepID=UPI0013576AF9|nr:aminomethyl-transferring glycine dehydrogenase subunit GcvPA [Ruania rhizosphaerae]